MVNSFYKQSEEPRLYFLKLPPLNVCAHSIITKAKKWQRVNKSYSNSHFKVTLAILKLRKRARKNVGS